MLRYSAARPHALFVCVVVAAALQPAAHGQTKRALLIGIGNYAPPAGEHVVIPEGQHAKDSRFDPGASWKRLQGPPVDVENMRVLLQETFQFTKITVLPEQQATRQGILNAIDQLANDTQLGDFVVIYYAGHGSRRLDTLSSKDHMDQTIVPVDAWKGVDDIRDKELAVRFNSIVYGKRAHLTAIFDSCNSGTMARGISTYEVRALAYDDRDVALEKQKDPTVVVEADLKQIPQNGNAIIVAAAAPDQDAAEGPDYNDHKWHGAFSRALCQVLRSNQQTLSAADVVAQVSNMLHAAHLSQQPLVEGRAQQSLFGAPVPSHPMHVHIVNSASPIAIDMGSAGGFDVGTRFTATVPGEGGKRTILEVTEIDELLHSIVKVVSGPPGVEAGQIFELSKTVYPQASRLVIFAAEPENDPAAAQATAATLYPGLKWASDPTDTAIDYLVSHGSDGWTAYGQTGQTVPPGPQAKGAGFLLLGLPAGLRAAIEGQPPFQKGAFTFTQKLPEADYLLAMRPRSNGQHQYAFIDRDILKPHKAGEWVRSEETDALDTEANGGMAPEVVCRNDTSLPVRTGWLPEDPAAAGKLVAAINRRIVRLGKLRVWLETLGNSPGAAGWPYHLAISSPGGGAPPAFPLHAEQQYEFRLVTTAAERAATSSVSKFVYILGFDCAANPVLVFPESGRYGAAGISQPRPDGVFELSKLLGSPVTVSNPLGADTFFLLVSDRILADPGVLYEDGEISRGPQDATGSKDATTRGPTPKWMVQSIVIPSRK